MMSIWSIISQVIPQMLTLEDIFIIRRVCKAFNNPKFISLYSMGYLPEIIKKSGLDNSACSLPNTKSRLFLISVMNGNIELIKWLSNDKVIPSEDVFYIDASIDPYPYDIKTYHEVKDIILAKYPKFGDTSFPLIIDAEIKMKCLFKVLEPSDINSIPTALSALLYLSVDQTINSNLIEKIDEFIPIHPNKVILEATFECIDDVEQWIYAEGRYQPGLFESLFKTQVCTYINLYGCEYCNRINIESDSFDQICQYEDYSDKYNGEYGKCIASFIMQQIHKYY